MPPWGGLNRPERSSPIEACGDAGRAGSPAEIAQQVLHMVCIHVGDDVLVRERPTARTSVVGEHLEGVGVEVRGVVGGTVEWTDLGFRATT
jgi:hypothetical protein